MAAVGPDASGGMIAVTPGLIGGTKVTVDSVSYTAGDMVRKRRPKTPLPRLE